MQTLAQDCAAVMLEAVPAAMRVIRQHMRSRRLPGMSVTQFRVLGFLDHYGPATLTSAAEHVGTALPSMSRMIQLLVEGQLIHRHTGSPDRRTVCLEITTKGRRVVDAARKATVEQLTSQLGSLNADEVGRLKEAMGLLLRVFVVGSSQHLPQGEVPR